METFNVRNPSIATTFHIQDMGQDIPGNSTVDLMPLVTDPLEIVNSQNLHAAIQAGHLIRDRGGDVAYNVAYDDLVYGQEAPHQISSSWARSIALLSKSWADTAYSNADVAQSYAAVVDSEAEIAVSLARINNSYASDNDTRITSTISEGDIAISIARHGDSLATSNESLVEGNIINIYNNSLAASEARSMAKLADVSQSASIAVVADSVADLAEGKASNADSVAERAASLARVAIETSDISEAASLGQRGVSIALLAELEASQALSLAETVDSETEIAISLARLAAPGNDSEARSIAVRAESLGQGAESQGTLDNSIADLGLSLGYSGDSLADRSESIARLAQSIARSNESQGLLDNSLGDYGISLARIAESTATVANTPRRTISGSEPSSPTTGDEWFPTDDDSWYTYDGTDWISNYKFPVTFNSRGNIDGGLLSLGETFDLDSGYPLYKDSQLVGIAAQASGGNTTKGFEVRRNGVVTSLKAFSLTALAYNETSVGVNLNASDFLNLHCVSAGSSVANPIVTLFLAWRR